MVIQFLAGITTLKIPNPFKSKSVTYDKKSHMYIMKKVKMPKLYGEKGMPLSDQIVETLKTRLNVILSFVGLIILIYVGYSQFS